VKFWDASAIVPLLLDEPRRERLLAVLERDPVLLVWWGTPVECTSAIARRESEGALSAADQARALERLGLLKDRWQEVLPSLPLRNVAERLLRVHPLHAADSLQLAAAVIAAEREPPTLELVSLDERLNEVALKEGFRIVDGS
jgi:predicted nucleic acid-binding protein